MKTREPVVTLVLGAILTAALAGCAARAADEARAPAQSHELNREDAIASARQDAARSYGEGWGGQANAQYRSGYWVVELHAPNGYGLRYAISAADGSIRERGMVQ